MAVVEKAGISFLIDRIKNVLFEPKKFFESIKTEYGYRTSVIYLALINAVRFVFALFGAMLSFALGSFQSFEGLGSTFLSFVFMISLIVIFYFVSIGMTFVIGGIFHLWIKIWGGIGEFDKTYQLYVYSMTPSILIGAIPFVGGLLALPALIYDAILLVMSIEKFHALSRGKAIAVVVIPIAVVALLIILAIILFFLFIGLGILSSL